MADLPGQRLVVGVREESAARTGRILGRWSMTTECGVMCRQARLGRLTPIEYEVTMNTAVSLAA